MSYVGFGIQNVNSFRKPRQAFRPIFEQLANGEHPIESNTKSVSTTWKETQAPNERDMMSEKITSTYVYFIVTIGVLASLLFAMA